MLILEIYDSCHNLTLVRFRTVATKRALLEMRLPTHSLFYMVFLYFYQGKIKMNPSPTPNTFSAFRADVQVAAGVLHEVATSIRVLLDRGDSTLILIFDDLTGHQIDVDLRGSIEEVAIRYGAEGRLDPTEPERPRRRGRPKLGVVGREVTLLPRHWAWLQTQRGGPSASLRRLVDEARALDGDRDRLRLAQDAINRFISATAGNFPGFEEANRALYRGDRERFEVECAGWPLDIRRYIEHWAPDAFGNMAG